MDEKEKIFIGVAWPYVNGDIHVGHLGGYLIPCDLFARYSRMRGKAVAMVSGADCHGTPITVEADKTGQEPAEIVAEYLPKLGELIDTYGISFELFTRTTTKNHKKTVQDFFINLLENGYISKKTTKQYYSESEDKFLPDRYVEGECSYCHAEEQRSDQCEECGRALSPGELIEPYSRLSDKPVELKDTEHYFLDYNKFQKKLEKYVEGSDHWRRWVRQETLSWLKEGIEPRAITRDIDWGIKLPKDEIPDDMLIENIEKKRFYVWFDAVIGYLSATYEWADKEGKDWEDFWKDADTAHYYFMGKDNLIFHTIFWPAQLMGQEAGLNLPDFPAVNHFMNLEGEKFSKSRGIHIDSLDIAEAFNPDFVRFYIASILPEKSDSNWKWEDFQETINNELINNIGNFIHRTLSFYSDKLSGSFEKQPKLEKDIKKKSERVIEKTGRHMLDCEFRDALRQALAYAKFGNQYFTDQKPWESLDNDRAQTEKIIYNCLQIIYNLRTLLYPFVPDAMDQLSTRLGVNLVDATKRQKADLYQFKEVKPQNLDIKKEAKPLFKKIEKEDIENFRKNHN